MKELLFTASSAENVSETNILITCRPAILVGVASLSLPKTSTLTYTQTMPLATLRRALANKKKELIELEQQLRVVRQMELPKLLSDLGLDSVDSLILELAEQASPRLKTAIKSTLERPVGHLKLDESTRNAIVSTIRTESMTGRQIAAQFGVSLATINNIKKAAGLSRPRRSVS